MTFVPAPGVVRLVVSTRVYGKNLSNTFYVLDEDTPNTPRITSAANVTLSYWQSEMLQRMSVDSALVSVTAYDMTSETAPVAVAAPASPDPGTSPNPVEYRQGAAKYIFRTNQRGRAGRGGFWLPGIVVDQINGNELTPAYVADLTASFDAVIAGLAISNFGHVLYGRQRNGVPLPTAEVNAVLSVEVGTTARVLNRRT